MLVCMSFMFAVMSAVVAVQGSVGMLVVYRGLLKVVGFIMCYVNNTSAIVFNLLLKHFFSNL